MSAAKPATLILTFLWLVWSPSSSIAQTEADPTETARVRYGPIAFTPALVMSTGHDTNVYRERIGFADYETFAVPQFETWWKQPGFRARAIGAIEFVHFANNVGAKNTQAGAGIERLHSTFRPYFNFNRKRTNANPTGFEVGYKSLRIESEYRGGVNLDVSPRSQFRLLGRFVHTDWDADAIYQTSSLREKLNHNTAGVSGGFAYALTPLTRIGGIVDVSQDRFKFSPIRDGNTLRVASLVEFGTAALIFGNAQIGYEVFRSPQAGVADFRGVVGTANLGYGSPSGFLLKLYVNRDLQYSYDTELGYYVLTTVNATAARRIGNRWDAAAFGARYLLDYRPPGALISINRIDGVSEVGAALAYRLDRWTRVGMTTERATKTGPDGFNAFRLMAFLTFGSGRFQRLDRPTPFDR